MSALRWTVLATQVPPGGSLGGIVRYTTELTRALAERDDVLVSAVTTRAAADTMADLVGAPGRVHVVPDLPTPALSLLERHLPLTALRREPDVLHGVKHLLPASASALRVLTVHDMLLLDRPHDFGVVKRRLLPGPYLASVADADLVLCVSDATRRRLVDHVPSCQTRSTVVPLAISPSLRDSVPVAVAALAGRRFALAVGDAGARKNLRTLVAAWPAVLRRRPDAVLAVAGPPNWGAADVGPMYQRLVERGAVIALGQVTDAELRWAYEHAAAVLCPSLAEGFGLPVAEALHFDAPLVVSDDPALGEVAAGRATATVSALDVDGWIETISEVLSGPRTVPAADGRPASRSWADVAADTVAHVRRAWSARVR